MVYGGEALSGWYTGGYLYSGGSIIKRLRKKREIQKGKKKAKMAECHGSQANKVSRRKEKLQQKSERE